MQLRKAFLAAIATLPLLAGGASAHGGWGGQGGGYGYAQQGGGHGQYGGYDGRGEMRRGWAGPERAREWRRHDAWEHQRHQAPRPYYQQGGWGPRW